MITGALTIFCLLYFLGAGVLKLWNLWHKGEKVPWWASALTWVFGVVVFTGLLVVMNINYNLAAQDAFFEPDLLESIYFVQFGMVALVIISMLTIAEIAIGVGLIATQGFGVPSERKEKSRF